MAGQLGEVVPRELSEETSNVNNSLLGEVVPRQMDGINQDLEGLPLYMEQLKENFAKRIKEGEETGASLQRGDLSGNTGNILTDSKIAGGQAVIQGFGKVVAGSVWDTAGVAIGASIDGFDLMIPESAQESMKEASKNAFDWAINTAAGNEATEAFYNGKQQYEGWKEKNPQYAKTFESLVNIGMLFGGGAVRAKANPVEGVGPTLAKQPYFLEKSANMSGRATRQTEQQVIDNVKNIVAPKITEKNIAARGAQGEPLLNKSTPFKAATLNPTVPQQQVIEHIASLKEITKSTKADSALIIVTNDTIKAENQLNKILLGQGDKVIPIKAVKGKINLDLKTYIRESVDLADDAGALKVAEKYQRIANNILKLEKPTPAGVNLARRNFDDKMKESVGLSPEEVGVKSKLAGVIRASINRSVDDVVPLNSVKSKRDHLNLNYRANDAIAPNATKLVAQSTSNLLQNLLRISTTKRAIVSAFATLGAGVGVTFQGANVMALQVAAAVGLGVTSAIGANLLIKGFLSPSTKKALATILRETDKAIKFTTNDAMKKSLNLSRVQIVGLMNLPTKKEQEQ